MILSWVLQSKRCYHQQKQAACTWILAGVTSLHESLSLFLWARLVLTEYLNKESTSCWTKILGIRLTKRCSKTCYAPTKTCYIYFIIVCNNGVYYSITTNRFQICQNSSGFKSHNWFWISNSEMVSPTPSWFWCSSVTLACLIPSFKNFLLSPCGPLLITHFWKLLS